MMGIHWDFVMVVHQASFTDWIQAVAALVAVVGTLFTLWKLYQRDEQKQAMIGELQQQTKHFGAQVDQLGAQVFQLKNIHEAIAKGIEYMAKDEGLKVEFKKIEIRPDFAFQSHIPRPGRTESLLNLLNRGGLAQHLSLTKPEGVPVMAQCPEEVRSGDKLTVKISSMEMMEIHPIYDLHFEDAIGNGYTQRFDMRHGMPKAGPVKALGLNHKSTAP